MQNLVIFTTMNPTIQFQFGSAASTTTAVSQIPSIDNQQKSSTRASVQVVVPEALSSLRRSSNGKLPRLVVSATRETGNADVRSRMQEARVVLGREFYGDLPKTLASVRLSRGYSQQQVAAAIGTSQPAIAKLEAGSVNIFWDTGKRLAQALGLSLPELDAVLTATAKLNSTTAKA
jgi:DNA-binding XRE family transcriptional regulator